MKTGEESASLRESGRQKHNSFQNNYVNNTPYSRKSLICGSTAAGILVLLYLTARSVHPSWSSKNGSKSSNGNSPFSLLVALQFLDINTKIQFLQDLQPLMDYVQDHELTTIGYQIMTSDKDDLKVLLLERYVDKENAYLTIHKSSDEFLTFRPKLQALMDAGRVTVSGESYEDVAMGFVGRS